MKNKLIKIISILSIVIVLATVSIFPASAADDYSDYLGYWMISETVNFPNSALDTVIDGIEVVNNYNGIDMLITKIIIPAGEGNRALIYYVGTAQESNYMAYGQLRNVWYTSRTINVLSCNQSLANFLDSYAVKLNANNSDEYNQGYEAGYNAGYNYGYSQGQIFGNASGYQDGYDTGYNQGYDEGVSSTGSQQLGKNLLVDTLTAPMNALNEFVLYESSDGLFEISLGDIVGGVIAFSLFIAFLKLFAGG